MISPQNSNSILKAYFESYQQSYGFNWIVASVYEISHEEIVSVGAFSSYFEKFFEIEELSVDITANGDWALHVLDITFLL